MKVSIIVPVYNVEDYLEVCLDSALNQDYKNLEILAVNDGSTDKSGAILAKYAREHHALKVISTKNEGLSCARNTGLANATGDFILFLDSDDWLIQSTVSSCVRLINENDLDIVLFSGKAFADGVDSNKVARMNYKRPEHLLNKTMSTDLLFDEFVKSSFIVSACFYLFKKDMVKNIRFKPGIYHEDNLFTSQLLLQNSQFKGVCINDEFFQRRVRPNSIMTIDKNLAHIEGHIAVAEGLVQLQNNLDYYSEYLNSFTQKILSASTALAVETYGYSFPFMLYRRIVVLMFKTRISINSSITLIQVLLPRSIFIKNMIRPFYRALFKKS